MPINFCSNSNINKIQINMIKCTECQEYFASYLLKNGKCSRCQEVVSKTNQTEEKS